MRVATPRPSKQAPRPRVALAIVATLTFTAGFDAGIASAAARRAVATIADLRALPPPTWAEVVAVACHSVPDDGGGGSFRFDVRSWAGDNDGTVVAPSAGGRGRWLRIYRKDLSVRWFGARGDGVTFDTAALQAAVDALRSTETLRFPVGVYRVDTVVGVKLKSDVRLDLGTATLAGTNVDGARCRLLSIEGAKNVVISGGTLVGSRLGSPQWGVGILASDAENLTIESVRLQDFFFDGILLTGNRGCRYVSISNTASLNNRRAGLSVVSASDVTVTRSTFQGTSGQSPQAGVNVEANAGTSVARVRLEQCAFVRNAGIGLYVHRGLGDAVSDVTIAGNVVKENDQGIAVAGVDRASVEDNEVSGHRGRAKSGIVVGDTTGAVRIADNDLLDNFRGILAADATVEILRNIVVGTGPIDGLGQGDDGDGIVCRGITSPPDETCVVAGNNVSHTAGAGILALLVKDFVVADNVVDTTGQRGLFLRYASSGETRTNSVSAAGLEAPGTYYALELAQDSDGNLVTGNVIEVGTARGAIGIGSGCEGNSVYGNVVLP